jgi:hypothetical protein
MGESLAGPMVHTILALRIDNQSLVIGQSVCARDRQDGRDYEIPTHPAFSVRPAFPASLARMFRNAILANDFQAHNATVVSGVGRQLNP